MRIRSTDILFGLPALELRRLLKRVDAWDSIDVETVREVAPMSRNAAKRLLAVPAAGLLMRASISAALNWCSYRSPPECPPCLIV